VWWNTDTDRAVCETDWTIAAARNVPFILREFFPSTTLMKRKLRAATTDSRGSDIHVKAPSEKLNKKVIAGSQRRLVITFCYQ
jgi:hypothetical protein